MSDPRHAFGELTTKASSLPPTAPPWSSESPRTRAGIRTALAIGSASAGFFGLVEWTAAAHLGAQLKYAEANRGLCGVTLAYMTVGALLGALSCAMGRRRERAATALATTLAVLLGLLVLRRGLEGRWLSIAAALGLAFLTWQAVPRLVARLPLLARADVWWLLCVGLVLSTFVLAACGRGSDAPPDSSSALVALAVALAGAAALTHAAAGLRGPTRRLPLGLPVALVTVLASTAFLGTRLPSSRGEGAAAHGLASVLLVTIDTLRADRVGAYGYARARTPNLDALSREGTLFRHAVSQNVFTGPSHTSILTGLLPEHHGVLLNEERVPGRIATLPDLLGKAGYDTAAFVGGYTTTNRSSGLPGRFQYYDDDLRPCRVLPLAAFDLGLLRPVKHLLARLGLDVELRWPLYRPAEPVTDSALEWLACDRERPFCLWVHFFDPHLPYAPPVRYQTAEDRNYEGPARGSFYGLRAAVRASILQSPEALQHMRSLYDAEIAYADDQLGRVVAAARAAAGERGLLTVVTSDHGEAMGEHGLFWNRDLYDDTLLVPLIILEPAGSPRAVPEVTAQVRLIDVTPTILEHAGVLSPTPLDGSSLRGLMHGATEETARLAHSAVYRSTDSFHRSSFSVRTLGHKLIVRPEGWLGGNFGPFGPAARELYDLVGDPAELQDLSDSKPQILPVLQAALEELAREHGPIEQEISPESEALLRSLGYAR